MFHRLGHCCGRWRWPMSVLCQLHLPQQWPNLRNTGPIYGILRYKIACFMMLSLPVFYMLQETYLHHSEKSQKFTSNMFEYLLEKYQYLVIVIKKSGLNFYTCSAAGSGFGPFLGVEIWIWIGRKKEDEKLDSIQQVLFFSWQRAL